MIIFRYLSKDILMSTFAVSFVLLLIFLTGRFVSLLADAAAGKYAVDVLFLMIGYRIPGLMQVILPLGFFIAILLAYGRLYMESEMVVMFACGMSQRQLIGITFAPAFAIALVVTLFSFWLSPLGAEYSAKIEETQRNRSEFDSLNAGRFQLLGQSQTMAYVDDITNNRKRLDHVFVTRDSADKSNAAVAVSNYAEQVVNAEYGQRYLVLHDGFRYEGQPGTPNFRVTKFSTYGQYIPQPIVSGDYTKETDAKPTAELITSTNRVLKTEFQWRLAFPVLVFVATLMAIPLSKTNPRQGRFLKMLPALLLYIFYFTFLMSTRSAMASGKWPLNPGLWVVHIPFFILALLLLNWEGFTLWRGRIAAGKTAHA